MFRGTVAACPADSAELEVFPPTKSVERFQRGKRGVLLALEVSGLFGVALYSRREEN